MNKIEDEFELRDVNKSDKYEKDWRLELFALIGFCFSGAIFIVSGIKSGDIYTIIGSSVWIMSCVIWIIPYRKHFDTTRQKQE